MGIMRYINDIFFIWTENKDDLEDFFKHLNEFYSQLRFIYEKSSAC